MGLRLRDAGEPHFTWLDLYALTRHPTPGTAYYRSVHGHDWTIDTVFAAAHADANNAAIWQRGGGKGPKPKPVWRPTGLAAKRGDSRKIGGNEPADIDLIRERLEAKNGRR